jgi:hypothetical protein
MNARVTARYLREYSTVHQRSPSSARAHPRRCTSAATSSGASARRLSPSRARAGHHSGFGRASTTRALALAGARFAGAAPALTTRAPKNLRSSAAASRCCGCTASRPASVRADAESAGAVPGSASACFSAGYLTCASVRHEWTVRGTRLEGELGERAVDLVFAVRGGGLFRLLPCLLLLFRLCGICDGCRRGCCCCCRRGCWCGRSSGSGSGGLLLLFLQYCSQKGRGCMRGWGESGRAFLFLEALLGVEGASSASDSPSSTSAAMSCGSSL